MKTGAELKTLFWLQWKLTVAMFRSRRTGDRLRVLQLLLLALQLVFTFPMFLLMGAGLAVGLILLSPQAAYEAAMLVNTFLLFIWLVLPASYNSQIIERFEMARLFPHPISFRSIVVGSTLMSMLTMTGLWTLPLLAGEIIGLTFHQPLALPLILLGALPVFALLVLTGRIMDDFFDLVAGDRRLRALVLALLSLPFMLCWVIQYSAQYVGDQLSRLNQLPFLERLSGLEGASGPSEFLEILSVSRLLIFAPPGWATAGMALTTLGKIGQSLLFLALSLAFVALLLRVHAGITRKLMEGSALTIGTERVRSGRRRLHLHLPGPPTFWTLFHKDWLYLRRSPLPRRMIFSSLVIALSMALPMQGIASSDNAALREALPLFVAAFIIIMAGMAINLSMTANYFGAIDREGFATLALAPIDRRQTILSANLAMLVYTAPQYLILLLVIALLSGSWVIVPLGLFLGLGIQVGGAPAFSLAAIIGPYRAQLKFSRQNRGGNLWGLLAWLVSVLPILALIVPPYIFWKPALLLTLPLGVVYSLGLYILTLKPLAGLLQRREHAILEAVTKED